MIAAGVHAGERESRTGAVGGEIERLLRSVFATRSVNSALKLANGQPAALGWIDGNPAQVVNQLIGAGIGIGLAAVGTLAALKITGLVTPLRMKGTRGRHRHGPIASR
jgi:ammonia channel protein AmtB